MKRTKANNTSVFMIFWASLKISNHHLYVE
jgi:hypothetical protein